MNDNVTVMHMIRLDQLQSGDVIVIQDTKKNELRGKVLIRDGKISINAFNREIVLAVWKESRIDPGDGEWAGRFRIVDYELALPGV